MQITEEMRERLQLPTPRELARRRRARAAAEARTPTNRQVRRILEALDAGDRMDARTFDDALALLGMDDDTAADRLGADGAGIIRAWRTGDLPLPLYVAKHVHSLVAAHRPVTRRRRPR